MHPLLSRLSIALVLPLAGCWTVDSSQETVVGEPAADGGCLDKDDPSLVLRLDEGSRCSPKTLESVDEGPVSETSASGRVLCVYQVTTSVTVGPEFCIGSGRPLRVVGRAVVAPLARREWA